MAVWNEDDIARRRCEDEYLDRRYTEIYIESTILTHSYISEYKKPV